ncbi:hypothetical protein U1Q18_000392, partial [Sarracenia purpurea var. burkii]
MSLDLAGTESRSCVFHNGWISVGKDAKAVSAQFHLNVKTEPDPKFVFQFDGEPECSPQVFQIHENIRQPVFTCKFSFRRRTGTNGEDERRRRKGRCGGVATAMARDGDRRRGEVL